MMRRRLATVAALLLGCAGRDVQRPSLDGPYACGPHTCTSGQICVTESAGSQCQVNFDAGIGPYATYSWMCVDLPAACDGIPSCSCAGGPGLCLGLGGDGREVDYGCI
jgi:hypothetical protein